MNLNKFSFAAIFMTLTLAATPLSFAHGTHFHSLAELESHIAAHIIELDALEQSNNASAGEIRKECSEIEEHARAYKEFAAEVRKDNSELASRIEKKSLELAAVSHEGDLRQSLQVLRDLRSELI